MDPASQRLLRAIQDGTLSESEQSQIEQLLQRHPDVAQALEQWSGWDDLNPHQVRSPNAAESSAFLKANMDKLKQELKTPAPEDYATLVSGQTHAPSVTQTPIVDGFDILGELGRGGMGVVYAGFDRNLSRQVAVKVMSPQLAQDERASVRMLREARAAAMLQHENIVAIHSVMRSGANWILIQQYVDGQSLQTKLDACGRLTQAELIKLARELAKGLAAAHAQSIVHRDLKPANILLDTQADLARIADFGLAKVITNDGLTREDMTPGTPAYMSPEQASGKPIDHRSDLYSLGVVLFRAATGQLPFDHSDPYALLEKVRQEPPPSVQRLCPELDAWFATLIQRLLEKKPENRPQSAQQILTLLDAQMAPAAIGKQRRTVATSIIAVVAGVVLAAGWWLTPLLTNPSKPDPSTEAKANEKKPETKQVVDAPFLLGELSYPSLQEAIDAAESGNSIRVLGDGPYYVDTVHVLDKELSIVAEEGSHPTLLPLRSSGENSERFLGSNRSLTLRGLNISWTNPGSIFNLESAVTTAVIACGGSQLTMEDCRIERSTGGICVISNADILRIERCWIGGGDCCLTSSVQRCEATIKDSVIRGKTAIVAHFGKPGPPSPRTSSINLSQCSVVSECFLDVALPEKARNRFAVSMNRNVIDTSIVMRLTRVGSELGDFMDRDQILRLISEGVQWREQQTIYRDGTEFLALRRARMPNRLRTGLVANLQQWTEVHGTESQDCLQLKFESATQDKKIEHRFSDTDSVPEAGTQTFRAE